MSPDNLSTSRLDLPLRVTNLICTSLFRSTVVYPDFALKLYDDPPFATRVWWASPICKLHPNLSVTFVSRRIRQQSLPLFYRYALFDLKKCCTSFISCGQPEISPDVIRKLRRVRGNCDLLVYLRLIDLHWMSILPAPRLQVEDLWLAQVTIDVELTLPLISVVDGHGSLPYTNAIATAIRRPRRFKLELNLLMYSHTGNLLSQLLIQNDLSIKIIRPPIQHYGEVMLHLTLQSLGLELTDPGHEIVSATNREKIDHGIEDDWYLV